MTLDPQYVVFGVTVAGATLIGGHRWMRKIEQRLDKTETRVEQIHDDIAYIRQRLDIIAPPTPYLPGTHRFPPPGSGGMV